MSRDRARVDRLLAEHDAYPDGQLWLDRWALMLREEDDQETREALAAEVVASGRMDRVQRARGDYVAELAAQIRAETNEEGPSR